MQETLDRLKSSSRVIDAIPTDPDAAVLYMVSDVDIAIRQSNLGMIRIAMGRALNNLSECA
ncbi:MAG TPA: hypothetical protein VFB98_00135 [Candidatus Deferrimicrobium sp.]|nr:hypothetical protein [Candidatus Deferrimicrobium sp.]